MIKNIQIVFSGLFILILALNSCESSVQKKSNKWPDSIKIQLLQEQVFINMPNSFKRSSRYKIKQDMPLIGKDSSQLKIIQTSLEYMEFEDAEIDVFVDTTAKCRMIVIANTEHIPFDKKSGSIINSMLKDDYANLEKSNPLLKVTKLDSRMKSNNKQKVLKFKHEIANTLWDSKLYKSIYFITTKIQSFIVYEISIEKEDIEYYLWSIKD